MIIVIDNDEAVRTALTRLLRSENLDAVAYASAPAFLAERDQHQGPGCILLDINMPEMSGIQLQRELDNLGNRLPIIFLTGHADVPTSVKAMKRGAMDFLTKPVDAEPLLEAVQKALTLSKEVEFESSECEEILRRYESLTPREKEVVSEVLTGAPNKVIARRLDIAEKTVKVHRSHIMEKMEVSSVARLVQCCFLLGVTADHAFQPEKADPGA